MPRLLPHFRRLERSLRGLLRRHGRNPQDTEDLIQEALLRLHEYCRTEPVQDEFSFLLRTVRNLSVDLHRKDRRHVYESESVEELDLVTGLPDERPQPDVILDAQRRLREIDEVLLAISQRTRDIYFAHRAGFSYAEIGEHLNISSSTIEKHIAKAVLALMDHKDRE